MLGRLWRDDRKRFVALSARAASFCARFGEDYPNIAIEKIYHLLISDLDLGISELRATAEKWFHSRVMADSTIETLLAVCEEQVDAGRSPNRVLGWTLLWGALIESRQSRFERSKSNLIRIPNEAMQDEELGTEVRAAFRYIEWMHDGPEKLFLENIGSIRDAARQYARRRVLSDEEAEEFESVVMARIIDNDYAVLRRFGGSSSFGTYIRLIIQNFFRDFTRRRWRSSPEAIKGGPVARQLESLIYKNGYDVDTAVQIVKSDNSELSLEELVNIAEGLSPRLSRRQVGEEVLETLVGEQLQPDELLQASEMVLLKKDLVKALYLAVSELRREDQVILKMKIEKDRSLVDIARSFGLDSKPLYRRYRKILDSLRSSLQQQGIESADVKEMLRFADENASSFMI